jgi:uncharacterized surface protein with fasciclin (FAS1) repeats
MKRSFVLPIVAVGMLAAACAPAGSPTLEVPTQSVTETFPTDDMLPTPELATPTETFEGSPTPFEEGTATEDVAGPGETVLDIAIADGRFTTLVAAVQAAGLEDTLSGPGPFTVFAPTDDAFASLPAGALEDLLLPENQDQLRDILLYHVVPAQLLSVDLTDVTSVETALAGQSLSVNVSGASVLINDAEVILPDIEASNGMIHAIDTVLLPDTVGGGEDGTPSTDTTTTAPARTTPTAGAGGGAATATPDIGGSATATPIP